MERREDVDSVPLVDEMRYYISQLHGDGELSGSSPSSHTRVQPRIDCPGYCQGVDPELRQTEFFFVCHRHQRPKGLQERYPATLSLKSLQKGIHA